MLRQRSLGPALLLLFLAALVGCRWFRKGDAAEDSGPKAWSVVTSGIDKEGNWSKDAALRAFALGIAPVPGVDVPRADDSVPECAVPTLAALRPHLGTLTPEQKRAIHAASGIEKAPRVTNAIFYSPEVTSRAEFERAIQLTKAFFGRSLQRNVVVLRRASLGTSYAPHPVASASSLCARPTASPSGIAETCVVGFDADCGTSQRMAECSCVVAIHQGAPATEVFVHELVHCYEMEAFNGMAAQFQSDAKMAWYVEGYAEWARWKMMPEVEQVRRHLGIYLEGGDGTEGQRFSAIFTPYSAMGLFMHLESHGVGVKERGLTLVNHAAIPAFGVLAAGATPAMTEWASSTVREPSLGSAWTTRFDPRMDTKRQLRAVSGRTVTPTTPVALSTTPGMQLDSRLPWAGVEVLELAGTGTGRVKIGDAPDFAFSTPSTIRYCANRAGCVCPQPSPPMIAIPQSGDIRVAIGGAVPSGLQAKGITVAEACANPLLCGAGKYRIDPASAQSVASERVAPHGYRMTAIAGAATMDIGVSGACTTKLDRFGFEMTSGDGTNAPPSDTVTRVLLSGVQTGRCQVTSSTITFDGPPLTATSEISVRINGRWMTPPVQPPVRTADLAEGLSPRTPTRYRCSGRNMIVISPDGKETLWLRE